MDKGFKRAFAGAASAQNRDVLAKGNGKADGVECVCRGVRVAKSRVLQGDRGLAANWGARGGPLHGGPVCRSFAC